MSGTTVDSIYLAQTGSHLKGSCLRGSANVASPDGRVSLADLKRAAEEAKRKQPSQEDPMFTMFVCLSGWTVGLWRTQLV